MAANFMPSAPFDAVTSVRSRLAIARSSVTTASLPGDLVVTSTVILPALPTVRTLTSESLMSRTPPWAS
ncbi:hypothetical protein SMICM304S_09449 [Streptomyces microflavus]